MGERFLALEEAAADLDAIQPALGEQFRIINGLPDRGRASGGASDTGDGAAPGSTTPTNPADAHDIRMVVGDQDIRSDCSCGDWTSEVDLDGIDAMVLEIRQHLGLVHATSDDGIRSTAPSTISERRAG